MFSDTQQRYQDIAFFHIEKSSPPPKKSHPLATAAAVVVVTVILIGLGYCIGWKAGYFAEPCCFPLGASQDWDFDFNFSA